MTLTRATLGKFTKRKTTDVTICGDQVRLQKPTPLEYSQYLTAYGTPKGEADMRLFPNALLMLTAKMWIDADGNRIFADNEVNALAELDNDFYEELSSACQRYAKPGASTALGESEKTTVSGSPAGSASS